MVNVNSNEWNEFQKWKSKRKIKFKKLTKHEFLEKVLQRYAMINCEEKDNLEELFQYNYYDIFIGMPKKPNVKFSLENFDCMNEWSHVHTGWNNEGWIAFMAGGDWEVPVFGVVYFDGDNFNCYIPENGNCYNKKTNVAWGSGYAVEKEQEIVESIDPEKSYDIDLLNADVKFFLKIVS